MASICVHRAPRTPLDSTPGHIRSRVGLQEEPQPATHSRQCPIPRFPANHFARQSPFYVPAGHIGSRDGIDLCPSSAANPSRHRSRAYRLARCFAGRTRRGSMFCRKIAETDIELPRKAVRARLAPNPSRSCNSSVTAIAIPRASRTHRLARWHRFVSIEHREPL